MALDFCSSFSCCFVWGRIWHHSRNRKFLYVPHNTDTQWSLKTWNAFSAIFRLWSRGGTSWYFRPFFFITSLNSSEHLLSSRCNFCYIPISFNYLIIFWYNIIISPAFLFLIGSLKLLLLYRSNSIILYLFPQNNITGNLPVWSGYILRSNLLCKLYFFGVYYLFPFFSLDWYFFDNLCCYYIWECISRD